MFWNFKYIGTKLSIKVDDLKYREERVKSGSTFPILFEFQICAFEYRFQIKLLALSGLSLIVGI